MTPAKGEPPRQSSGSASAEVAAVAEDVPELRKAPQPLHRGKIDEPCLQHFVRRVRAVDHAPLAIVADDRRAAQAFQNADLDFLRAELDQPVEAAAEARHVFAGQARDEVGVNVDAAVLPQPAEIVGEAFRSFAAG